MRTYTAAAILCLVPALACAHPAGEEVSPQLRAYCLHIGKAAGSKTLVYFELVDPVGGQLGSVGMIALYRPAGAAAVRQFNGDAVEMGELGRFLGGEIVGTSHAPWRRTTIVIENGEVEVHHYPAGDPAPEARLKRLRDEASRIFPGVPLEL